MDNLQYIPLIFRLVGSACFIAIAYSIIAAFVDGWEPLFRKPKDYFGSFLFGIVSFVLAAAFEQEQNL